MTDRTTSSEIIDAPVCIMEPRRGRNETEDEIYNRNHLAIWWMVNGQPFKIVGSVCRDDLYDVDGNRFYFD